MLALKDIFCQEIIVERTILVIYVGHAQYGLIRGNVFMALVRALVFGRGGPAFETRHIITIVPYSW